MWRRERMMVDVISLQNKVDTNTSIYNNKNTVPTTNNTTTATTMTTSSLLQNRTCYPFGGGMHDDTINFYAGNEYNMYGDVKCNNSKRKRPLLVNNNNNDFSSIITKRQKPITAAVEHQHVSSIKTNYTFTSKPYDVMENLMYYY
jgi:hypothetical protein